MAIRMACSWNSGTPMVLPRIWLQLVRRPVLWSAGDGIDFRLERRRGGADRDAPYRPGSGRAHDGDLDDEIIEVRGFRRGSMFICARLSTWNTPIESARHSMS